MGAANTSASSVFEMMDYKNQIEYPTQGKRPEIQGRIEFRDVYFRYPDRKNYVLNGLSFTIMSNEKVAFTGASGTGKSTIFNLILRFYDPEKGAILLDGIDIKEYDIQHLRSSFGLVSQEPRLFNSTISKNIKSEKAF